jgi:hypothetical protein
VASHRDEADERWRDVLFEIMKRAKGDAEFRARVEATGAVLDNFEAVLDRVHKARELPASDVSCREYWWGFQLEIPHATLSSWEDGATDLAEVMAAISAVPGPVGPFRKRASAFVVHRIDELRALDRGAGIQISMMWMAPNIFVPFAVRRQ